MGPSPADGLASRSRVAAGSGCPLYLLRLAAPAEESSSYGYAPRQHDVGAARPASLRACALPPADGAGSMCATVGARLLVETDPCVNAGGWCVQRSRPRHVLSREARPRPGGCLLACLPPASRSACPAASSRSLAARPRRGPPAASASHLFFESSHRPVPAAPASTHVHRGMARPATGATCG
jgi:hypothetical protein